MWGEGGKCVLLEVQNLRKILGCMQAPTIQRLTRDYVVHTYILITCMYFMCMCTDHVCMYIHCLTIKKKNIRLSFLLSQGSSVARCPLQTSPSVRTLPKDHLLSTCFTAPNRSVMPILVL